MNENNMQKQARPSLPSVQHTPAPVLTRLHSAIAAACALAIAIIADRAMNALVRAASAVTSDSLTVAMQPVFTPYIWFGVFWFIAFAVVAVQFFRVYRQRSRAMRAGFLTVLALGLLLSLAIIIENHLAPNTIDESSAVHTILSAVFILPALAVLFTQIATGLLNVATPGMSVVRWLRGCFIEPFANWGLCMRSMKAWFHGAELDNVAGTGDSDSNGGTDSTGYADSTEKTVSIENTPKNSVQHRAKEIAIGLLMLIPMVVVLIPLLMQSDEIFSAIVEQAVFSFDVTAFLGHAIFVICFGWLLFSLFAGVWLRVEQSAEQGVEQGAVQGVEQGVEQKSTSTDDTAGVPATAAQYSSNLSPTSTAVVLLGILALYAVFCAIQVRYLVFGLLTDGTIQLPAGLTYSEYARSGFFQLIAVVLLNLLAFGLVIRYCKQSRLIYGLLTGLLVLSMVMASSDALRLSMYIDAYGLTWLRLVSITFIPVVAIIIVLAGVRLRVKKLPLIAVSLTLVLIWWIALGIANPTNVVMWFNTTFGYAQSYL